MTAPPEAGLVATERCAVEPLVHAPEAVQPACIRRVGVVHDTIVNCERVHAGPFSPVCLPVCTNDARCELVESGTILACRWPKVHLAGSSVPTAPDAHSSLVCAAWKSWLKSLSNEEAQGKLQPIRSLYACSFASGARYTAERDVVIREVDSGAVETVRDRGTGRTPCGVLGPEHEVIDEKLRASSEEIGERRCALVRLEAVLLVDSNPGQILPLLRQFIATPRQSLLGLEQLQPRSRATRYVFQPCDQSLLSPCHRYG